MVISIILSSNEDHNKTEEFRTIKLKHETIYNCTESDKNCKHVHSSPVEIVEVKDKGDLPKVMNEGKNVIRSNITEHICTVSLNKPYN